MTAPARSCTQPARAPRRQARRTMRATSRAMRAMRTTSRAMRAMRTTGRATRTTRAIRVVSVAAGLASIAGLAACGSVAAPPGSQPTAGPRASTGPASVVATCAASALRVTLDGDAAGAAAGSSYVPLDFANTSSTSCKLPSYPAVAFASGAAGPQIGTPATLENGTHASTIVLAPHGVAHAWLQIVDVANYPAGQCKPVQARGLRVSFTGTDATAFLAHPFQACAKAVHGSDVLAVFPVQAGQAKRGTAP
jgi:hypothetical protein